MQGRGTTLWTSERKQRWKVNQILFLNGTTMVEDEAKELRKAVPQFGKMYEKKKQKMNVGKRETRKLRGMKVEGRWSKLKLYEIQESYYYYYYYY